MRYILAFSIIIFFTSCTSWYGQDKYQLHVTMERDGEVTSYTKGELSITNGNKTAEASIEYYYSKYKKTNITIDKDIYDFYVVIPIKTRQSLNKLEYMYCVIDSNKTVNPAMFKPTSKAVADKDGYYHYLLYVDSRVIASSYYLNDIKDAEIYFEYSSHGIDSNIDVTSNKLSIPKEEFEHMLERLAISHERLSFQPEGY